MSLNHAELFEDISVKLNEILRLSEILSTLLNSAIQDAIGAPGVPCDLEMIVYISKQFASIYERMVEWALYFKALRVDEIFEHLLQLLYELPKSMLAKMDDFVDKMYNEITGIPDVEDDIERRIILSCVFDEANTDDINAEIKRLRDLLH